MNLRQLLYRTEIRLLPVIASFWVKLGSTPNYEDLIHILCERITDPKNLSKMLNGSEGTDLTAGLKHLSSVGGQEEVSSFEKRFGTLRIAGTEKVLREKYWKNPVSAAEKLFYRGLIFRENRLTDGELKECFILPDDMIPLVVRLTGKEQPLPLQQGIGSMIIRPAAPSETEYINHVYENLPDLFTLAAAQKRDGHPFSHPGVNLSVEHCRFIESLLTESKLFSSSGSPDSEKIRSFMIQNRISARLELIRSWRYSNQYDELSENTLQLEVLESPDYDKRSPRGVILNILRSISADTWLSLSGFIAEVKKTCPLFLREAFVRHGQIKDSDENDLSGIGSWFQLEGSYLRFLLFGPLKWLGITQTAYADKDKSEPTAFRISKEAMFYLQESQYTAASDEILAKPNLENAIPNISADGVITCNIKVPRYFRYMAARCCEIERIKTDYYTFRITPNSLAAAENAGITKESFAALLKRFSKNSIPPSLERMLTADGKVTLPATIYRATILTVPDPVIINDINETPRLEKWILQQINQNSLMIDSRGIDDIRRFLMEKEIFVDIQR